MLTQSKAKALDLLNECKEVVIKAFYVPILENLHGYHALEVWTEYHNSDMPIFSLSHTSHIGRVGEHLLTLIQRLEIESNTELYDQAYL